MLPACGLGPFHTRKASLDAVIILGALYVITGGFVNPIIATDRHTNKKAAITGWCCTMIYLLSMGLLVSLLLAT